VTLREAYDRELAEVFPGLRDRIPLLFEGLQGEFEYQGIDGEQMLLAFKAVPLPGKEGRAGGALLDLHDLTQLKRMAGELKRADELAAVGALSARMAHEIRNPLAAISGSVQLVALRDWPDEKDKRLFSIILRETDRLDGLLRDFLFYAKPSTPAKVPLQLRGLISELIPLLAQDPRLEGITIENRVPSHIVIVFDKDQCKQVFWNLLVNAAEAMSGSGRIVIDAAVARRAAPGDPDQVRIRVRDTGQGMDEAEVKRVFEPFFTTKKGGTGLGLATVYRIVETHGGRIAVFSEPGKGTTLTLYLPG